MNILEYNDFVFEKEYKLLMERLEELDEAMMSGKELAGWVGIGVATAVIYDVMKKLAGNIKSSEKKLADLKQKLKDTPKEEETKREKIKFKIQKLEDKIAKKKAKLEKAKAKYEKSKEKDKAKKAKD